MKSFREFEQAGWNDRSTAEHYDRLFSSITTQTIDALLQAARIAPGHEVLDVATGPGYVAGAALARGARVTAIDFSQEKLALARARYPGVRFLEGDAEHLDFDTTAFNAVTCNYGLPHFSEPQQFFAESFRVLRPGGTLAFSVWDDPARCRVFGAIYEAIAEHGSMNVGLPTGPNFFLFSAPENCLTALRTAGFIECAVHRHQQNWSAAAADDLFEAVFRGSVRAAGTLHRQTEAALCSIRHSVSAELEQYRHGDQVHVPMPALIAAGRKPG